jgi:hypothetical protein
MNNSKIFNWLQVSANIGIVLGLVLVGLQIKQSSDLTKIELLYEESRRFVEFETMVVGENAAEVWAKSLEDPENLTLAEVRIMESLLWSFVEQLRGTYRLAQLGLIEEEDWRKRVESEVTFYLSDPYSRAWWKNYAGPEKTNIPPELLAVIQASVAADNTPVMEYIMGPSRSLQNEDGKQ